MYAGGLALAAVALLLTGYVVWRLLSLLAAEREAHRAEVAELLTRIQHPQLVSLPPGAVVAPEPAGVGSSDGFELAGRDFGDGGPVPDYESQLPPFPVGEMP